ncbi:hypothetical protein Tsubulata_037843 [Turnera subulata]|uniref:GATA-type domain-containing protein n=1 Tax=Turnera subulata TaxID=218843 RepID=A0A9Q0JCU9_9ROSI|nr:hypothetical protein Tsubulata_037843 [Turnera subulata]
MTMSPLYLNPAPNSFPAEEQQLHLFLSPLQASSSSSSLSGPTLFNATQNQGGKELGLSHQSDDQFARYISCDRFSDHQKLFPPSPTLVNDSIQNLSSCKREDGDSEGSSTIDGSEKWMPSKMRLMQKMMVNSTSSCSSESEQKPLKFTLKFQDQRYHTNNLISSSNSNNNSTRVCSDCNTTTTPLWRSGPLGPKSLCNACGIRQRKARRAMAAAAAAAANGGTAVAMESCSSTKIKVHKEKKSRAGHVVAQCKKVGKPVPDTTQTPKKLCFKNLALSLSKNSALQRVLPQDVEEAAILLMELSCGFIQS